MKPGNPSAPRKLAAFSLMELLIVITIIGILTSIMIPTGQMVTKAMRKTQAMKMATELRTAIMNYYSEYKRFPVLEGASGGITDHFGDTMVETSGESGLIAALLAVPDNPEAEKYNRRGISFLSVTPAKQKPEPGSGPAGVWREGNAFELADPWGYHYFVLYDSNMDNAIKAPSQVDGTFDESVVADVAVWSTGPDGQLGKVEGKKNDDIYAY